MKIDFERQVGVARREGNKIITAFVDRDSLVRRAQICRLWNFDFSRCLHCEEALE